MMKPNKHPQGRAEQLTNAWMRGMLQGGHDFSNQDVSEVFRANYAHALKEGEGNDNEKPRNV